MAINVNRVIIGGNLTREPETRYIPNGTPVTSLRLAVNRQYTTKEGNQERQTTFVAVTVWGKQAELCHEYLHKGNAVLIEGRLQSREWETNEKERRSVLEVVAERVHFLTPRKEGGTFGEEEDSPQEA